jgi:putative ABC transport system permease protein
MAWRNIWRNTRRSLLTMAAICFATLLLVFMLSWQFGSYDTMINASVAIHTGHLQVQAAGYQENPQIRKVVPDPQQVGAILHRTPEVAAYTFRADGFALISSKTRTLGVSVVGIDPKREVEVSTLAKMIRQGHFLAPGDRDQALVGRLLARNLKAGIGDELVLLGQGRDGSIAAAVVRIKGIFDSGLDEFDRGVMHLPLAYFQEVFSMDGGVNRVVAVCRSLEAVPAAKAAVQAQLDRLAGPVRLVALSWRDLNPGLVQGIHLDLVSGFIFYLILIVVVAFSILNTFLMAIFERTREFGVMLAMGTAPGRLIRILLLESAGITLLGLLAGIVAGGLLTWYFQVHGIVIPGAAEFARQYGLPERMYPQLSVLSVGIGAGIVLTITFLTALFPALRVGKLRPVAALHAS